MIIATMFGHLCGNEEDRHFSHHQSRWYVLKKKEIISIKRHRILSVNGVDLTQNLCKYVLPLSYQNRGKESERKIQTRTASHFTYRPNTN